MDKIKVLLPTDFTVQSEYAALMVKNLRMTLLMDIHLLHVLQVPDTVTLDVSGNISTCGEIDPGYVQMKKEIADRNLHLTRNAIGGDVNTHLVAGFVTDSIVSFASENKFDLIVMGTKGDSGLHEKISGSETQVIVRNSEIPVLSMHCDRSDLEIKNLLLIHDFSEPKKERLELILKLASAFDATIHCLQVVSPGDNAGIILNNMDEYATLNGIKKYDKHVFEDDNVEHGVRYSGLLQQTDLLCIGTHARKGIQRLIHPSTAEKLVNHLYKPILTYHL
jgi:nucleotide-binding universal stress UspA family protein